MKVDASNADAMRSTAWTVIIVCVIVINSRQFYILNSTAVSQLPFWQEHSRTYPILSTVARRMFAMSASSAQSERDFSAVGRTVTDARSQLSASKVGSACRTSEFGLTVLNVAVAGYLDSRTVF